jgi:hypothetical protein
MAPAYHPEAPASGRPGIASDQSGSGSGTSRDHQMPASPRQQRTTDTFHRPSFAERTSARDSRETSGSSKTGDRLVGLIIYLDGILTHTTWSCAPEPTSFRWSTSGDAGDRILRFDHPSGRLAATSGRRLGWPTSTSDRAELCRTHRFTGHALPAFVQRAKIQAIAVQTGRSHSPTTSRSVRRRPLSPPRSIDVR